MRTFLIAATALLAATPAVRAQGNDSPQRIDTTFAFAKGGLVDLVHASGDIVVTGWTKPEIRVHAFIETGYFDASMSSSRVGITARSRRSRMGDSRIELSVPIGTEVRAATASGNIVVRGVAGAVSVNCASGDIEVRDAAGRVEVRTFSGDVRGSQLRGRIRVSTTSGEIRLDDVDGELFAKSVSGDVRVRGLFTGFEFENTSGNLDFAGDVRGDGSFTARTHSGDLSLTLPSNLGASLELQTYSGEVRPGFPITLEPGEQPLSRRNRRMRFTVNGGGPRIGLETFSGDIIIERGAARAPRED